MTTRPYRLIVLVLGILPLISPLLGAERLVARHVSSPTPNDRGRATTSSVEAATDTVRRSPHHVAAAGAVLAVSGTNYVQTENAKPGTSDWRLTNPGWASGVIEGYASATSVNRGGQISFFVNTSDPTYTLEVFRIGYYQGLGGRRMTAPVTLTGVRQPIPSPDPTTGLIECNWTNPYTLTIPNTSDPTDWMSGFYYVKLTGSSGYQQYITFVVRDDTRASDLLLGQTVTTAQAYNPWGGKSLYGTLTNRSDTTNAARKVSFDRPFYGDETNGAGNFSDRNDYKYWEWGMVQFLESNGYDVTYATNIDVDRDPNLLLNHKAFLSVGHDEYWSWRMRDNVEHARDVGVSLGFFSGNTSYWQVRFENSVATSAPYRVMVGYKDYWQNDPITPDYLKTARFRSNPPVNRPEDQMIGVMFITQARCPFVVEDASSWVLSGTGLKNGDSLVRPDGSYFVGYEVDGMNRLSPPNTQRIAHSPVKASHANFADMTVYRATSGATVFATGSIMWTYDVPAIVQITRNVLARFINGAFSDTTPIRPSPPAPFAAQDIGDVGRPGFVSMADATSWTINGAGQDVVANTNDALFYVYQQLSGDGQIVARITGLQLFWDNRAGLMIRESLSPGSKYVSVVSRPSESKVGTSGTGVNEGAELKVRGTDGTIPSIIGAQDLKMPNWLKLARAGNTFTGWLSADGVTWSTLGTVTVPMSSTVYIGTSVASAQHGVWATASFDNVAVSAAATQYDTQIALDTPANNTTVGTSFTVRGWAINRYASTGTGVDAVNIYAAASGASTQTFLGSATYGLARSDVAATYGSQFTNSGFTFTASLSPGTYTLRAYAHNTLTNSFDAYASAAITVVQATTNPFMNIDTPAASSIVTSAFEVGGWAIDAGAPSGSGVDAVHFYAFPNDGASPAVFLGIGSYGAPRADVANIFGPAFTNCGFHFTITGLGPGKYLLAVYGHSTVTNSFSMAGTVHVTVNANALMSIDAPAPESAIAATTFGVSGWAIDRSAATGTGVDAVHVWAYPNPGSGQAPIFLGVATLGITRSDVANLYGSRFTSSGYVLNLSRSAAGLTSGVYDIVVFAHSTATNSFNNQALVRVTLE